MSKFSAIQAKLAAMREAQDARSRARTLGKAVQAFDAARHQSTMQRLEPVHAYIVLQYCNGDEQLRMACTCRAWRQCVNEPYAPRHPCTRSTFRVDEFYTLFPRERVGSVHVSAPQPLCANDMEMLCVLPHLTELRAGEIRGALPPRLVSLAASSTNVDRPEKLFSACTRISMTLVVLKVHLFHLNQFTVDCSPLRLLIELRALTMHFVGNFPGISNTELNNLRDGRAFHDVIRHMPNLQRLAVCQYRWTEQSLLHALGETPRQHLTDLSLHGYRLAELRQTHLELIPAVTCLNVDKLYVAPHTVLALLPQLTHLSTIVHMDRPLHPFLAAGDSVVDAHTCVRKLRIESIENMPVSYERLHATLMTMPRMRVLDLSCVRFKIQAMHALLICTELTHVALAWSPETANVSAIHILSACTRVQTFEFVHRQNLNVRMQFVLADVADHLRTKDAPMWRDIDTRMKTLYQKANIVQLDVHSLCMLDL
jgi:hypothetical protein